MKGNQLLPNNEKSFLFVLTDASSFHDDPRAWKEDFARSCLSQEPDYFAYSYELVPSQVCDIFKEGMTMKNVYKNASFYSMFTNDKKLQSLNSESGQKF